MLVFSLDNALQALTNISPTYLILGFTLHILYVFLKWFYIDPYTSPLKKLRMPPGGTGMLGHQFAILDGGSVAGNIPKWTAELGNTFRTQAFCGLYHRLWTIDHKALHYVLKHTETWEKPDMLRRTLGRYLKSGLINMEGPRHRLVRKICQPLFSQQNIRNMMPVFLEKGEQLRQLWHDHLAAQPSTNDDDDDDGNPAVLMDVLDSLNRLSFDIIGITAFEHDFNALPDMRYESIAYDWEMKKALPTGGAVKTAGHGTPSEGGRIYEEYDEMFGPHDGRAGIRGMLHVVFPILDKWFPTENSKCVRRGMNNIDDLTARLTRAKRTQLRELEKSGDASAGVGGFGVGSDNKVSNGRDLLSLIVKADMANDPAQRMTDDEIAGALATFMFAGTDTGSQVPPSQSYTKKLTPPRRIIMAWCLFHLAGSPSVQSRLREECLPYGDTISMEDLDGLPFLDMVVKEVYRLNPSIPTTIREAKKDDIVPLAEPIKLASGEMVSEIPIRKGQYVYIPIEAMNWAPSVWGPDCMQFNPDRWSGKHISASSGLGIDYDVLTFIDGPRKCLGYRMGTLEVKSALFTLVRHFEFARDPQIQIRTWNMFTNRPFALDRRFKSFSNMPIIVRQYRSTA